MKPNRPIKGQPSGPAPLKRWLESLSARDGAKPPAEAPAATDASIAIELGSLALELQEVAPAPVEDDAFPTRMEATAFNAPTRQESPRARDLAALTLMGRFKRWLRRMTIRLAVVLALLGGGLYFARPYLPGWASRPLEAWLRSLPKPLGSGARAP